MMMGMNIKKCEPLSLAPLMVHRHPMAVSQTHVYEPLCAVAEPVCSTQQEKNFRIKNKTLRLGLEAKCTDQLQYSIHVKTKKR